MAEALAYRIQVWVVELRQSLVDDCDLGMRLIVGTCEESAAQQFCLQGAHVVGGDVAFVHHVVLAIVGPADEANPIDRAIEAGGRHSGDSGALDARQCRSLCKNLPLHPRQIGIFGVESLRHDDPNHCEMVWMEVEVDVNQAVEAFAE